MGGISAPSIIPNVGQNTNRMNAGKQEPKTEAKPKAKPQIVSDEKEEGLAWVLGQTAIATGQTVISALDDFGRFGAGIMSSSTGIACSCEPTVLPEPVFDVDAGTIIGDGGGNVRLDGGTLLDSGIVIHDAGLPHDGGGVDGCVEWVKIFNNGDFSSENFMEDIKRIGESNDFIVAGAKDCDPMKPLLVSINSNGDQNWVRAYNEGIHALAESVDINSNGEIIFAGNMLGKTDRNGNLYWSRSLGLHEVHSFSVRALENKILVGVNQSDVAGGIYIETDLFGEESRRIEYLPDNTYTSSEIIYVHETSDGGSFIVGNSMHITHSENDYGVIWLVRLDSQGNEIFRKYFDQVEGFINRASSAQLTNDGIIIVSGREAFIGSSGSIYLYKIDFQGNIIWMREYNNGDNIKMWPQSVKQKKSGGYIITGSNSENGGLIIETDDQGNLLHQRFFQLGPDSSYIRARSVEETTELDNTNGMIVVGAYDSDQPDPNHPCDYRTRGFIKKFCPMP